MKNAIEELIHNLIIFVFMLGYVYWWWMAFKLTSFWMFVLAIFPPGLIVSVPLGTWSLLFGQPEWLLNLFG